MPSLLLTRTLGMWRGGTKGRLALEDSHCWTLGREFIFDLLNKKKRSRDTPEIQLILSEQKMKLHEGERGVDWKDGRVRKLTCGGEA